MKPKRIQRKRTKGWRMPEGAVYVGRPTKWGNTFDGTDALDQYRHWFEAYMNLEPLRGKDLVCWCPLDQPCHADILLEIANA